MPKKWIAFLGLCLCLLLLCGCGGGETAASTESGNEPASAVPRREPTGPTEHVDSGFDEEVQAAIDGHETKRFWRVEAPGSFPETVSLYSWTGEDGLALWPTLREKLLSEATELTEKRYHNPEAILVQFKLDGKKAEARIFPEGIEFAFSTSKRAVAFAELLAAEESERLGLSLRDLRDKHGGGRKFVATPELDGMPMDNRCSCVEGIAGDCGVWNRYKTVYLSVPMDEIRVERRIPSDSFLSPEELCSTLLFMNGLEDRAGFRLVTVYQSCEPIYCADARSHTIRPAWRVTGKQYVESDGKYKTVSLELLADALTGEIFVSEGIARGI